MENEATNVTGEIALVGKISTMLEGAKISTKAAQVLTLEVLKVLVVDTTATKKMVEETHDAVKDNPVVGFGAWMRDHKFGSRLIVGVSIVCGIIIIAHGVGVSITIEQIIKLAQVAHP